VVEASRLARPGLNNNTSVSILFVSITVSRVSPSEALLIALTARAATVAMSPPKGMEKPLAIQMLFATGHFRRAGSERRLRA
jgi:hypothetical protein